MVFDVIKYLAETQIHACSPWLIEILRCHAILHEERTNLKQQYPDDHKNKWASKWPFNYPEYTSPDVTLAPYPRSGLDGIQHLELGLTARHSYAIVGKRLTRKKISLVALPDGIIVIYTDFNSRNYDMMAE
ncbi:hypothetical protein GGR58DRAFT_153549 [Xylaria digitata]|nr:hypothetical protein GGR58DRAFT_153549 [Xylaria digitata]